MQNTLSVDHVSVYFDGLKALSDVSLGMGQAQVTGLIGPNGAGKTTLVNVMTGFQSANEGRVTINDESIAGIPPHRIRKLGIARTFQSGRLFADLSVVDNLEVTGVGLGLTRRVATDRAYAMLDWMGISKLAERTAGGLPYTDERRVAIGRAIMLEPKYLLLDEPAAGMSAMESKELCDLIRKIVVEVKCGILLIEHNIGLVLSICDYIHVLDSGMIIEAGSPADIKKSEKVRHAYMGTQTDVGGTLL